MTINLDAVTVRVKDLDGDELTLLQKTSLSLGERRIAVIGANGSGKSTLLRLFNGLISPSSGTVSVNGLDSVRDGAAVRRQLGFMFTDPLSQLVMPTAVEDVELSLRRSHRKASERRTAALEVLDRFGLASLAEQSVYSLSGGERQLVALSSVLAVEPQILVLDEPTTLLDLVNTHRLIERLKTLPQQIIIATHDLELAAQAERLLVVDQASVVYDGEPAAGIRYYRELALQRAKVEHSPAAPAEEADSFSSAKRPEQG
ncbi:energy-coupling factor ABC transporter ATP-binding protein [Psychromicrobium lacuslunae]|uniref:energy-coupling factor ABC transporter ATP-binding protein n=1 Tax=Psychromicrobium lacuslunae TaxID=1618207 RepID=UPI0005D40014|nr:ABC transporter ATP-binding protein [Psychromicrobium lacuslunae]